MKMHEKRRENFEMLYETSRFEDDIVMGEPSEKFKALDAELQYEENRRNQIAMQRRQEVEELDRQKRLAQA